MSQPHAACDLAMRGRALLVWAIDRSPLDEQPRVSEAVPGGLQRRFEDGPVVEVPGAIQILVPDRE